MSPSAPLIRPFSGLLPRADMASRVAAPPYDVVTSAEARQLAAGNPWSFLHVSKGEIDLPEGTDPYSPAVYERAGANLRSMLDEGVVYRDAGRFYYVYRIEQGDHVQTGLAAAGAMDAYLSNRIRKHELTRPDKEDDRVRQIEAVGAQTGPVFAVHRSAPAVSRRLARIAEAAPEFTVAAADGSRHSLWRVADPGDIAFLSGAYAAMDAIYIADGHHRSAAAARVARLREERGTGHDPEAPCNAVLIVCFPEEEARILGYHRVVRDLGGQSPEAFLERLRAAVDVEAMDTAAAPEAPGLVSVYLDARWYRLDLRPQAAAAADAIARLDVSLLSRVVLEPLLGIGDPRRDPRIDFVGGRDALEVLQRRVDGGEWAAAFALHPLQMRDLFAVADAQAIMPPKSTWFDPKLLDGLVSYPID